MRVHVFLPAALLGALIFAAPATAVLQEETGTAVDQPRRELLDAIRDDLVNLRFEKALAAIEAFLGEPGMSEPERAEALVLRAQAHAAFGDLDGAEEDYRQILRMRPGYEPESSLTPRKAMDRFRKVRDELVGTVRLVLEPTDARITVDGRVVAPKPGGVVPLLAGEHELRAERAGHDPISERVRVEAGKETPVEMRLLPNARTVVIRSEPEDVEVILDGQPVGRTARIEEGQGAGRPPAELMIENLPLGEHVFELRKECYRTERLTDVVTIDLLDRTPKVYKPVQMVPAHSTLALSGGPAGADVAVDGEPRGRLPLEPFRVCPGDRTVEVRFGGRAIWSSRLRFEEAVATRATVTPRPNFALVGAEELPVGLAGFGDRFNTTTGLARPDGADLSTPKGWEAVGLPSDTDLALAVVPSTRTGAADSWYLFSPLLKTVRRLVSAPPDAERPRWETLSWGLSLVDSAETGATLVAVVTDPGPAAAAGLGAGDRILSVGGREISGAADVRATLGAASPNRPIAIRWSGPDGEVHEAELKAVPTPRLDAVGGTDEQALVRAAWAMADSIDSPRAASALANLALLFGRFGHHDLAADTWRRVRWGDRPGIGEGTKQYYLGRELERLGRDADAIEAFRRAAASRATVVDDDGPAVAPAARDRLADLGVTVNAE